MNNDIIIDVNNISKVYKLYDKPVDRLKETLHPLKKIFHKEFHALSNINFQVKRGETIGIIGKNGAGKSTLLKIITGVLTPTSGSVRVNGKISSLLELGAGFNPEFTGIENIYLNGTLMGYNRNEMDAKLPSILEFADIGDFVHQPVKIYSSGMYVRLAFSVAINVEPELLIVDEALSVGDARFQLKCYKKLEEIRGTGTTILLVTHSIEMIKSFSTNALLFDSGKLIAQGDPVDVALEYYRLLFGDATKNCSDDEPAKKSLDNSASVTAPMVESAPAQRLEQPFLEIAPEMTSPPAKKYGKSGVIIEWIRIYGLREGNVFAGDTELSIVISHIIAPAQVMALIADAKVKNNLLFGIRVENSKGFVLTDIATSTQENFLPIECDSKRQKIVLEYKVRMPLLADGEYWFSPGVAVGYQEALAPVVEYPFLFSLRCSPSGKVLGAMKFHFDVRVKE